MENLEETVNSLRQEITSLLEKNVELEEEKTLIQQSYNSLEDENAQLQLQLQSLSEDNIELEALLNNKIAENLALHAELVDTEESYSIALSQIDSLESDIATLNAQIDILNDLVEDKSLENDNLESVISSLEALVSDKEVEITEIKANLELLSSIIESNGLQYYYEFENSVNYINIDSIEDIYNTNLTLNYIKKDLINGTSETISVNLTSCYGMDVYSEVTNVDSLSNSINIASEILSQDLVSAKNTLKSTQNYLMNDYYSVSQILNSLDSSIYIIYLVVDNNIVGPALLNVNNASGLYYYSTTQNRYFSSEETFDINNFDFYEISLLDGTSSPVDSSLITYYSNGDFDSINSWIYVYFSCNGTTLNNPFYFLISSTIPDGFWQDNDDIINDITGLRIVASSVVYRITALGEYYVFSTWLSETSFSFNYNDNLYTCTYNTETGNLDLTVYDNLGNTSTGILYSYVNE